MQVGTKVRSHGPIYVSSRAGYRKVHTGVVVAVKQTTDMGVLTICKVATRYGDCWVNPSQLVSI
jgi:hypothetical protein